MSLIWPSCPLLNLLNIYADVHDKDFLFQMSKRSISRNCHHSNSEIKTISFEGDMLVVEIWWRYVGDGGDMWWRYGGEEICCCWWRGGGYMNSI